MNPEQIVKTLVNESFHSRRLFVTLFVVVNVMALAAGFVWPKNYTSSTSILVDDKNVIQPLMLGAAVATDVADRGKNAREVIFSHKIMTSVLERGGWMKDRPSAMGQDELIEQIKKRTTFSNAPGGGKAIINITYRDHQQQRAYQVTKAFADLFIAEVSPRRKPRFSRHSNSSTSRRRSTSKSLPSPRRNSGSCGGRTRMCAPVAKPNLARG